jgi:hypothetical protein
MILWRRLLQRHARSLACVLVAVSYAVTFAGCASDLTGRESPAHEAALAGAAASESAVTGSPKPRSKNSGHGAATRLSEKHKKPAMASWTLESKADIPAPDSELLAPPPEPNCEMEAADLKGDDPRKLSYEKQCYRSAEIIARGRLLLLQSSVDKIIKARFFLPDR